MLTVHRSCLPWLLLVFGILSQAKCVYIAMSSKIVFTEVAETIIVYFQAHEKSVNINLPKPRAIVTLISHLE
jgi:hypothetical protein